MTKGIIMEAIISGIWDEQIIKMARETKSVEQPMMFVFGHEVNGDWFPWCGTLKWCW